MFDEEFRNELRNTSDSEEEVDDDNHSESVESYESMKKTARLEKAEDVLLEMMESAQANGEDTAFFAAQLADLDNFVRNNKEELDGLLESDATKKRNNNKKRGIDDTNDDDHEVLPDSEAAAPAGKKSA